MFPSRQRHRSLLALLSLLALALGWGWTAADGPPLSSREAGTPSAGPLLPSSTDLRQPASLLGTDASTQHTRTVNLPPEAPSSLAVLADDPHIVKATERVDRDGNRIADALERRLQRGEPLTEVVVALEHPLTAADAVVLAAQGGEVVEAWRELVFAARVRFPRGALTTAAVARLAGTPGVALVEGNARMRGHAFYATRQMGVRRVWPLGYEGNASQAIAVLDSGLDATHPDLAGRVAGWSDFAGARVDVAGDEYPTPTDRSGHGTLTAGAAAGSGAAAGMSTGSGVLPLTFPLPLDVGAGQGARFPVDTTGATVAAGVMGRLKWLNRTGGVANGISAFDDRGALLGAAWTAATAAQPFDGLLGAVAPGVRSFFFTGAAFTSETANAGTAAWLQVRAPFSAAGDGKPLMRGVAPACRLVGAKVLDDQGEGSLTSALNAVTWVHANRKSLNIVCVNASFGMSAPSAILDALVNQLVAGGVVWVSSAGNDREFLRDLRDAGEPYGIFAPGSAAKAITVAALNERDQLTNYSSWGYPGQSKPDLCAPGGSSFTGRLLALPDSNGGDADPARPGALAADAFPDDYTTGSGTSLSAPLVAGVVALMAQAMGEWTFTEAQALRLKSILLMTASETGVDAEISEVDPTGRFTDLPPSPRLDRGAKDEAEGYGRVNADAAIEALTQSYVPGTPLDVTLGPAATDRKVWARGVQLAAEVPATFVLALPPGADYDLYLYSDGYTASAASVGDPMIAARSVRAGSGGAESLRYVPTASGRFYLVVKRVAGGGTASLTSFTSGTSFYLSVTPADQTVELAGASAAYTIQVNPLGDFTTPVALSVASGLPAGVTPQFSPSQVAGQATSVLTLATSATTPPGEYLVTVQGQSAPNLVRTVTLLLRVEVVWPRFRRDTLGSGRARAAGPASARPRWVFPTVRGGLSSPAIGAEGTVYVGAREGALYAISGVDGTLRWEFATPGGSGIDSSPVVAPDGTIYVGANNGTLFALQADGVLRWSLRLTSAAITTGPLVAPDGTVYVTAASNLYAVNSTGTLKWSFAGGGNQSSSPTRGPDGTIYYGIGTSTSGGHALLAVRDNGTSAVRKWSFPAAGPVLSSPAIASDGTICFGSNGDPAGGRVYAITDGASSATLKWDYTPPSPVRSSPAISPSGIVYVGCDDDDLYALTPTGALKWRYVTGAPISSSPALDRDGTLYVGSRDGFLHAVRDGGSEPTLLWKAATGDTQSSPALGADGSLYVGSLGAAVYAFADNAGPNFSLAMTPGTRNALPGATLTFTVTVTPLNGFNQPVDLSLVGALPDGITATLAPTRLSAGTGTVTLTVRTDGQALSGEIALRVQGAAGTLIHQTRTSWLLLRDLNLLAQPASRRVTAGASADFSLALTPDPPDTSFTAAATLSAAVLTAPPGAGATPLTFTFGASSVTPPALTTLAVNTSGNTVPGTYTLEIRATSGTLVRTATLTLEVAGLSLTATPTTQRVTAGGTTTFTVTTDAVFGFTGTTALACSTPSTSITGTFSAANLAVPGSATLTVATTTATSPGSYTLTITGTSGAITRSVNVTLEVAGFNLTATPLTRSVASGTAATFTINVDSLFGFNQPVAVAVASPLPTGVTASFSAPSVTGIGFSTLTLTTATSTAQGTLMLNVTGSAGGIVRTVALTLVISASSGGG